MAIVPMFTVYDVGPDYTSGLKIGVSHQRRSSQAASFMTVFEYSEDIKNCFRFKFADVVYNWTFDQFVDGMRDALRDGYYPHFLFENSCNKAMIDHIFKVSKMPYYEVSSSCINKSEEIRHPVNIHFIENQSGNHQYHTECLTGNVRYTQLKFVPGQRPLTDTVLRETVRLIHKGLEKADDVFIIDSGLKKTDVGLIGELAPYCRIFCHTIKLRNGGVAVRASKRA